MSISLQTKTNARYKTCDIVSFEYEHFDEDVVFPLVIHGSELPDGSGFPYKLERPSLSFKTYRAMAEKGLKNVADRVITTKSRSHITPDNIWQGVLKYAGSVPKRCTDPVYQRCLDDLRAEVGCELSVMDMDEAVKHIPASTSPGLPFIKTHPGKKKGEIISQFREKFSGYWDRVGRGKPVTPLPDCAAFARSHVGAAGNNKVRPVWAYPVEAVVEEARFSVPLQNALKNQEIGHQFAYGMEMLKGGMTWLNTNLQRSRRRDPGSKFLMIDYTGFDNSIPAWLIRDVFDIVLSLFPHATIEDKRRFKFIVNYFINTSIQNMDGRRFQKWHGVPSGSMFTNAIDTMINFVVTRYCILKTTGEMPLFFNCFGDDSIASIDGRCLIDLEQFAAAALVFGMVVNTKKSYWTNVITNVHYLGYYNLHGDPVKPDDELVASMLFPQYLKDDWAYCIARSLGCLLASCGNSPNVFLAAQGVYWKAHREKSVNVEEGLRLIRTNPRMLRHLANMGAAEFDLSPEFFFRNDYSYPRLDCTKIMKRI
nr:hypothetical protein [Vespula vulgaris Partiti-like virus 2]